MPKIEYDVDVDKEIKRKNQYSHYVTDFLKSGHENMKIECKDTDEAIDIAKSLCMYRLREKIYNLLIVRRKSNVILLIRNEV